MFLLRPGEQIYVDVAGHLFTFQYVSIKTAKRELKIADIEDIYIPICFY